MKFDLFIKDIDEATMNINYQPKALVIEDVFRSNKDDLSLKTTPPSKSRRFPPQ